MSKIGSNEFNNISIPLVVENRFIVIEKGNPPLISIGIFQKDLTIDYEVFQNCAIGKNPDTEVVSSPTGIITISDKQTGKFLYKVRPKSKSSVLFGTISGSQKVSIKDYAIYFDSNKIQNCTFDGVSIGVHFNKNGGFSVCAPMPPELRRGLLTK